MGLRDTAHRPLEPRITVVHRGADATGTGIVSVLHAWGMALSHMAFAAMPIAVLWLGTGLWLGRRHERIRRSQ